MNNQSKSNQTGIEVSDIDFDKLYRLGKKVQLFLLRKIDNPLEIYLLLKILSFSIEETCGFRLDSGEEQKFKQMFS
jgi:hypothetical protein